MERLTEWVVEDGKKNAIFKYFSGRNRNWKIKAAKKLAEYEDLGCSPEELKKLTTELSELKTLNFAYMQNLESLLKKGLITDGQNERG